MIVKIHKMFSLMCLRIQALSQSGVGADQFGAEMGRFRVVADGLDGPWHSGQPGETTIGGEAEGGRRGTGGG